MVCKSRSHSTSALESGGVLISRAVTSQVPSALRGLTSVFGMGTGGTLLPSSPEMLRAAFAMLACFACSCFANRLDLFALLLLAMLALLRLFVRAFKTAQ